MQANVYLGQTGDLHYSAEISLEDIKDTPNAFAESSALIAKALKRDNIVR